MVLGKISNLSSLTSDEVTLLREYNVQESTAKLYHRVMISGIVYTTVSYMRSKVKTDCVLCFRSNGQKFFGIAKRYLSFCTANCTECLKPCKHIVIAILYQILPLGIMAGNTTIRQVHRVCSTRFVVILSLQYCSNKLVTYVSEMKIFFTKEIHTKCVYMKFDSPEAKYIIELPNSKEKNL